VDRYRPRIEREFILGGCRKGFILGGCRNFFAPDWVMLGAVRTTSYERRRLYRRPPSTSNEPCAARWSRLAMYAHWDR
jgi:hypothetical protein